MLHLRGDPGGHAGLEACHEGTAIRVARNSVAAVMDHGGTGEDAEQLCVDPQQPADHAQLSARGRQSAVVLFVACCRAFERVAGGALIATQQVGLARCSRSVIGVLTARGEKVEDQGCQFS
jgi:hypothetical protein